VTPAVRISRFSVDRFAAACITPPVIDTFVVAPASAV
jgi:hypothetical protein